jgi:hypothetical protein
MLTRDNLISYQGWYNTYGGRKVSRVTMCKVRSKEKTTKNKPKRKVQWSTMKKNRL